MRQDSHTFLIIDDDCDDCDIFCEAIGEVSPSSKCIVFNNPEKAFQALLKEEIDRPDYIFIDLNMPRMNGKTLLTELKNVKFLKNIPVIIYSTSSDKKDIEDTRRLGASHFITKPYNYEVLLSEIKFVLEEKWIMESK